MPNWCDNDLRVTGRSADLEKFLAAVKGGGNPFDFEKILPCPSKFTAKDEALTAKTGLKVSLLSDKSYDWRCKHWATKWNSCNGTVEKGKGSALICFETAWAPPIPVILKASKMFPTLTFQVKYYEGGMCFQGMLKAKAGKTLAETHGRYHGSRGG